MSYGTSSCDYTNLNGTYSCGGNGGSCQAPSLVGIPTMSKQAVLAVPTFGAGGMGYGSLQHTRGGQMFQPSCSGFFSLNKAYPQNCPPIIQRACGTIPQSQNYANLQ